MKKYPNNERKSNQLGMSFGTAMYQLRKNIMFSLVQELNKDMCFRCGRKIETVREFSIEHMESWLDNDIELFWDLTNISFSHLSCNTKHSRHNGGYGKKIISPDGCSWCSTCKEHKPREEFSKNNGKSGRNDLCTECKKCRKYYKESKKN